MSIHPTSYDKNTFLDYLNKNKVDEATITDFNKLPEAVFCNGSDFKLDINVVWYDEDETHYTFEMNYYSEEKIEYCFNSKVFTSISYSVKYLIMMLNNCNCYKGKIS